MKLVSKIIKFLKAIEIKNIDKKAPLTKLIQYKDNIAKLAIDNKCDDYELNQLVLAKQFDNANDSQLKKIQYIKSVIIHLHKLLLMSSLKSDYWDKNIKELKIYFNSGRKKYHSREIEQAFIQLLKKYVNLWTGFWTIIEHTKRGTIKSIKVFDKNDKERIQKLLKITREAHKKGKNVTQKENTVPKEKKE